MAEYWCRFLDRDGRVFAAERVICTDLEDAKSKARSILLTGDGVGFEVWEQDRRIFVEHPLQDGRA